MSTRITARFEIERHCQLKELFVKNKLVYLWRNMVKQQMRSFTITDLHDYYDFNYAIEARVDAVIERVLSGQYHAETPLVYREEKKFGVCRHMMIPTPCDALVFQNLTNVLYDSVVAAQPAKGAFYSRDRHSVSLPHQHESASSYPWFVLWPKFQKEIWNFTKKHKYLVTTDLSNYFDNIGLRELRHVISSITTTDEVYLDLLFSLIEDLSWNPDYLPNSQKGLPTMGIEAPRLLAHAFLFEIDHVLKSRTNNNFVRWMDDINFGVSDRREANVVLGEINDVLKSRGLALNLGKTEIMTCHEANKHFMFSENLWLDKKQAQAKKLKSSKARSNLARQLVLKLTEHHKHSTARHSDKVTKRYLTILGLLGMPEGLQQVVPIYISNPGLRNNVLRFLESLPFSIDVAKTFTKLLKETEQYDDAARFNLISSLINLPIPRDSIGLRFTKSIAKKIDSPKSAFDWLCQINFLAKYGEPAEVWKAAKAGEKFKEPFFARQRIAVLSRNLGDKPDSVRKLWQTEISHGYFDSASVAINLLNFANKPFSPKRDRLFPYLFPPIKQKYYPLPKFLILCALASSDAKQNCIKDRPYVIEYINDEWYKHWLMAIYPSWFDKHD